VDRDLDASVEAIEEPPVDLLALEDALERLGQADPRKSEIVHLRYFVGLSIQETAATLGLSATTVKEEWFFARSWLKREIDGRNGKPGHA
jgi:RNA polymerase sigma factor (sigma-70 family)